MTRTLYHRCPLAERCQRIANRIRVQAFTRVNQRLRAYQGMSYDRLHDLADRWVVATGNLATRHGRLARIELNRRRRKMDRKLTGKGKH